MCYTFSTMDIHTIKSKSLSLFQRYGVRRASVFGSVATGENQIDSDVDILIEMPEQSSLFDFLALKSDLEDRLACKVDLVEFENIRDRLKPYIMANQIPILS